MSLSRAAAGPAGLLAPGSRLWTALAPLTGIAVFALSAFTIYPQTDGWFAFPLGDPSLVPYRDYFFPVTPMLYFEAQASSYLSLSLPELRLGLLALPAFFALALASLAGHYVSRRLAFVVATTEVALLAALRLEPPGGWNTQSVMFLTVALALFVKTWKSRPVTGRRDRLSAQPFSLPLAILTGVAFFVAILVKQTVAVNLGLVLILFAVWAWLTQGRDAGKRATRLVAVVAAGVGVLAVPVLLFFSANGATADFIADMSSLGGKNPRLPKVLSDVIGGVSEILTSPIVVGVTLLTVGALFWLGRSWTPAGPHDMRSPTVGVSVVIAYLTLALVTFSILGTGPILGFASLGGLLLGFVLSARFVPARSWNRTVAAQVAVVAVVAPVVIGLLNFPETPARHLSAIATSIQGVWIAGSLISTLCLAAAVISSRARARLGALAAPTHPDVASRTKRQADDSPVVVALVTAVVNIFLGMASTGGDFVAFWFVPSSAVFIAFTVSRMQGNVGLRLFVPTLVTALLICTAALTASVIIAPYVWWGWREPPLLGSRVEADFGYLDGLRLAPSSYSFFSTVRDAELLAAGRRLNIVAGKAVASVRSGSAGGSQIEDRLQSAAPTLEGESQGVPTVFGFPNLNSTYTLTGLQPYRGIPCLSLWFDLCSNKLAAKSLAEFRKDPADVIVWMDPSDEAFKVHERLFLGQRSALRDWQAYRDRQVRSGAWVRARTIPATATSPNLQPVVIYFRAR